MLFAGPQGFLVIGDRRLVFLPGPMRVAQEQGGSDQAFHVLVFPVKGKGGSGNLLRLAGFGSPQMELGKREGHNRFPLRILVFSAQLEGLFQQGVGFLPLPLLPVRVPEFEGKVRHLLLVPLCPVLPKELFHFLY